MFGGSITAVPAYGRDYKSKAAVLEAWTSGKDFLDAVSGRLFSARDNLPEVWIRYDQKRKILKAPRV